MANAIDPPSPPPPTQRELAIERWVRDAGDKTLRLYYDLGPESTVVDLGGYEGQWASDIYAMYRCRIFVFEPVTAYAEALSCRFAHNDAIRVFPYGLASSTGDSEITVNSTPSTHRRSAGSSAGCRPAAPGQGRLLKQCSGTRRTRTGGGR